MSINIGTDEDPIVILVTVSGGILDAVVRAADEATFEAAARWAELRYEVTETITDPETGETTVQGTGEWATSKGVHLDHIGPVMVKAGTYDEDGNQLTAPIFDNRHHVNIRVTEPALSMVDEYGVTKWQKWAMAWSMSGTPDTHRNSQENALVLQGVSLIDAETIRSPSRVWL